MRIFLMSASYFDMDFNILLFSTKTFDLINKFINLAPQVCECDFTMIEKYFDIIFIPRYFYTKALRLITKTFIRNGLLGWTPKKSSNAFFK